MTLQTTLGIAVALAMDAFAVAIATGANLKTVSGRQTFRLSWHFGLFQAMMPIIGWLLGSSIRHYVENYAPWIAFVLLALVGTNMLREALSIDEEQEEHIGKDPTRGISLVMLSVATSIDALAIGLSLSMMQASIWGPAVIIGIVAGLFTIFGLYLGKQVARLTRLTVWAEVAGGLVLWIIGLNILRQANIFTRLFS